MNFLKSITENATALGILISLASIAWNACRYVSIKKEEHRQVNFENYHRLIKELVEGDGGDKETRVDRQIAVIFELRNLRPYYDVTLRIMKGLRSHWKDPSNTRLLEELDLAIAFMERNRGFLGWFRSKF